MIVEAVKKDDGYFIPLKGDKEKIKVYIEEDVENLDILSLVKNLFGKEKSQLDDFTKEQIREMYGDELYRKYLLLDKKTMEENWEYLVKAKKDWGDDFEAMEEAISNWNKA